MLGEYAGGGTTMTHKEGGTMVKSCGTQSISSILSVVSALWIRSVWTKLLFSLEITARLGEYSGGAIKGPCGSRLSSLVSLLS